MTTQGERLKMLIESTLNMSQRQFAISLGVTSPYINQIIKGKRMLSGDLLEGISKCYKQVNISWLLNGDGEIFLKKNEAEEPQHGRAVVEEPGERYEMGGGLLERMLRELEQLRARDEARAQELERLQQRVEELEARAVEAVTV